MQHLKTMSTEVEDRELVTARPEFAAGECPEWLKSQRETAWDAFQELPMPRVKDEAWRFAGRNRFNLDDWAAAPSLTSKAMESAQSRSAVLEETAGKLVFGNDDLVRHDQAAEELVAKGVVFESFTTALEKHGDLLQRHFMVHEAELGGAKFAALHKARVRAGTVLYVPDGVEVDLPFEVFHWVSGENAAAFPHTLVIAGDNARVTLVDHLMSVDEAEAAFLCGVGDIYAGPGSKVTLVMSQRLGPNCKAIQINSTQVDRDANAQNLIVNLGADWVRNESVSRLVGAGANSDMLSVSVTNESQEVDQRTLQLHQEPHTTSDLLYKNALYDTSRTIFAGLIHVDKGAHYTDAYQTCRNLLLSDTCEANAMPGLEINADQVKCSHGATSGQMDESDLFYMKSRGIPDAAARKLITQGFVQEAVDRLDNQAIDDALKLMLEAKFARL